MKTSALVGKKAAKTIQPEEVSFAVADFASLAAHELEQPLEVAIRAALSLADLALDHNVRNKRLVGPLLRNLGQLRSLVSDLETLRFVDSGNVPISTVLVEVAEFSKEVLRDFMILHPDRPIEWMCDTEMAADIDQVWFRRAIHEVLDFMDTHAHPTTMIASEARRSGEHVTFSFHNKTIELHPEDGESLFKRTETPEGEPSGPGWGLCAARAIVRAHQGTVWVESQPGIGTTAYIKVPVHSEA